MKLQELSQNLAVKIAVMLLIALTPVGAIAVWQTNKVIESTDAAAKAALISLTIREAKGQNYTFQRAFGETGAIGSALVPVLDDPGVCGDILSSFVAQRDQFTYAHFVDISGEIICRSENGAIREVALSHLNNMIANPKERVYWADFSDPNGDALLLVETPVVLDNQLLGYISLSLSSNAFELKSSDEAEAGPVFLLNFNDDGEILMANAKPSDIEAALPESRSLLSLVGQPQQIFQARAKSGVEYGYSVSPMIEDAVYGLAVWNKDDVRLRSGASRRQALIFPFLMLAISIGVAYLAVHRLVIRHVDKLRNKMQRFAKGDRNITSREFGQAPTELREIDETFTDMAHQITRDEAESENALHEKNVLLKEVHHRVKNNLQLIVSIINMQMRKLLSTEATLALKRVQDRVLGLSMVHGNLYQSPSLSEIDAGKLLSDIVDQLLLVGEAPGASIELEKNVDQVALYPDQAVSFSLLAAEAITNALKYVGSRNPDAPLWIKVELQFDPETNVVGLTISNSMGESVALPDEESTGLGSQLIDAFVTQLGAEVSVIEDDQAYSLHVSFEKQAFQEGL